MLIACNDGEVLVSAICKEVLPATLQGAKCGTATGVASECESSAHGPFGLQVRSPLILASGRPPFQPTINPGTSNRNRLISRSLRRDRCGVSASGIRNNHGPLIAAGARKNEKINTLVVHGSTNYHVYSLEGIVSKRKHSRYRSGRSRHWQ
jgi:hypothetical protein